MYVISVFPDVPQQPAPQSAPQPVPSPQYGGQYQGVAAVNQPTPPQPSPQFPPSQTPGFTSAPHINYSNMQQQQQYAQQLVQQQQQRAQQQQQQFYQQQQMYQQQLQQQNFQQQSLQQQFLQHQQPVISNVTVEKNVPRSASAGNVQTGQLIDITDGGGTNTSSERLAQSSSQNQQDSNFKYPTLPRPSNRQKVKSLFLLFLF